MVVTIYGIFSFNAGSDLLDVMGAKLVTRQSECEAFRDSQVAFLLRNGQFECQESGTRGTVKSYFVAAKVWYFSV